MSTVTENSTQDLYASFVTALNSLDSNDEMIEPRPSVDGEYPLPDLLDDQDLQEIMAMSDEQVMDELVDFGHQPAVINERVYEFMDSKVVQFPDRQAKQRQIEAKLEAKLLTTLIQEALLKRVSSTDFSNGPNVSQQVVEQYRPSSIGAGKPDNVVQLEPDNENHKVDETERSLKFFKRAFGIAASLFVVSSVVVTIFIAKYDGIPSEHYTARDSGISMDTIPAMSPLIDPERIKPVNPYMRTVYKPVALETKRLLPYNETIEFLEKIESGEINATPAEKLRIAKTLSKVATADALNTEGFSERNTCAATGKYEHVVIEGESLSRIVDGCAYKVADDQFYDVSNTINIGDILIFQISPNRTITRVEIEKKDEPLKTLYNFE